MTGISMSFELGDTSVSRYLCLQASTFHIRKVQSKDPVATRLPSGDTATHMTTSQCPFNGLAILSPVDMSVIARAFLLVDSETTKLESCDINKHDGDDLIIFECDDMISPVFEHHE